jgi:hypothetical protein
MTEERILNLSVVCRNQREEAVLTGCAVLKVLKEAVIE